MPYGIPRITDCEFSDPTQNGYFRRVVFCEWDDNSYGVDIPTNWQWQRRVDGGSWATHPSSDGHNPYTDFDVLPNHVYEYRVRSYGKNGWTAYSAVAKTQSDPTAPTNVRVTWETEDSVRVTWNYTTPTGYTRTIIVERDGQTIWQTSGAVASAGSYVDADAYEGAVYCVVVHYSEWEARSVEATLPNLQPPDPPLVTVPTRTVPSTQPTVEVSWTPNHPDGSPQTGAMVWVDGMPIEVEGAARSLTVPNPGVGTHDVQVQTRGVHPDWGPMSGTVAFEVADPPGVSIDSPEETVDRYPVEVSVTATDSEGVATLQVDVLGPDSTVLWTRTDTASGSAHTMAASLVEADIALENHMGYTVTATATNSRGLTATATSAFSVEWMGPGIPSMGSEPMGTGLRLHVRAGQGDVATRSLSVSRVDGSGDVPIASGLAPNSSCVDEEPPLNTDVTYRVTAQSPGGLTTSATYTAHVRFDGACVIDWDGHHTPIMLNPSVSDDIARDGELLSFPGVTDEDGIEAPLWYPGPSAPMSLSVSGTVIGLDATREFDSMRRFHGPWHVRLHDGRAMWCSLSGTREGRIGPDRASDVSLDLRRLAHG